MGNATGRDAGCVLAGGAAGLLAAGLVVRRSQREERVFATHFDPVRSGASVQGKPVLVVIDVQAKFIDDRGSVTNGPLVPAICDVAWKWMVAGHPIVFARFCYKQGQTTLREFDAHNVTLPGDEETVALEPRLLRAIYDSPYPERIFRIDKNTV